MKLKLLSRLNLPVGRRPGERYAEGKTPRTRINPPDVQTDTDAS
jgi:hypothetical protein